MSLPELAMILEKMYNNPPTKEKAVMIHLFAIKYAKEIQDNNITATELVRAAGLNDSYHAEISKGLKLSKYVICKDGVIEKLLAKIV